LCEQRDNTGGAVVKRFFGAGEQISGTNYFFTRDHLGSVREMTDGTVVIKARYDYDPYGRRTKLFGTMDVDFGYTGHFTLATEPEHIFTLYRLYRPDLGMWLSRDLLSEPGGASDLYAYAGSNPVNLIDQLGLDSLPNTSAENCFQNCLSRRRNAPGIGKAIKRHAIGHLVGTIGTGLCGLAAYGEGFLNLTADVGTVAFGIFEIYELADTSAEAAKLRDEAKKAFAICLMGCARRWNDYEDAYDFWEIYK